MQAYRSLHSYKQRYIHRNQYNETCNGKKNQYLAHIRFGHGRYEFEYDQILTLLSMHFSFAFFSRAPLLQTLQHYYMSIYLYIYMPIQGIPMMGMKGM
jgi:hypothetical protein